MKHIMSTEKKGIQVVTVTHLKDSVCNSILNLQLPAAGKHLPLTMVFLSFTIAATSI